MKIVLIGYGKMGKAIEKIAIERGHTINGVFHSQNRLASNIPNDTDIAIEFTQPHLAVNHIKKCIDFQIPIGCAGVSVFPGDVLIGDREGVLVIPHEIASEVAAAALEQHHLEEFLLEKIRAGAKLPGTYPPSEDLLEEYRKKRGK